MPHSIHIYSATDDDDDDDDDNELLQYTLVSSHYMTNYSDRQPNSFFHSAKKILNITVITVEQDNFLSKFNKYHNPINSPDHTHELNNKDTI